MNGIPVFQAEVPGRVRAGLEFRVGTADEPLHMAGVTHLIEPALDSMILIMPEGTQSPRAHFAPYRLLEAHPLPGSEVQHVYTPGMRMVVGPAGASSGPPASRSGG